MRKIETELPLRQMNPMGIKIDELVKSQKVGFSVIPAKAGI